MSHLTCPSCGAANGAWLYCKQCGTQITSRGHIGYGPRLEGGLFEYFQAGQRVYRASADNAIDRHGYRQGCRWDCSVEQFESFFRQDCGVVALPACAELATTNRLALV